MHTSDNFTHGLTRTAFLLEPARPTIELTRPIDSLVGFGDAAPLEVARISVLLQALAAWTGQTVGGFIEGELRAAERSVIALPLLPNRHMGLDAFLLDHPSQH